VPNNVQAQLPRNPPSGRLMLGRLLILATIVASAFDLPVKSAFDGDLRGLPCVEKAMQTANYPGAVR
jgi:hypothetical protein